MSELDFLLQYAYSPNTTVIVKGCFHAELQGFCNYITYSAAVLGRFQCSIKKKKNMTEEFFNSTCLFIVFNSQCVCPSAYSVTLLQSVGFVGREGHFWKQFISSNRVA